MKKIAIWLNVILLITTLSSCAKNRGCNNEWASNFDVNAVSDCCCVYDVDHVINSVVGSYGFRETCSSLDNQYQISISKRPSWIADIIIDNFNNSGEKISAKFNEGEFKFNNDHQVKDCDIQVTGQINKINGRLFFVYAAIPISDNCQDFRGKVCEGYSD